MKTKILFSILALGLIISALGQNTFELTFTAIDSATYIQMDSIKVLNRTQGGDTILYYPDTVLVLDYQVGISQTNIGSDEFQLFQNFPNPVIDQTIISFYVPEKDKVNLIVSDVLGCELIKTECILNQGNHSYQFKPGNGSLFLFTVQWRESSSSVKILHTNSISNNKSKLEYIGSENSFPELKTTEDIQSFLFSLGDELLYIGYYDTLQSGMLDNPETSEIYTFQFASKIPCLGTPTVIYEGQVYNTIQIYNQCWLKENLNLGTMIQGSQEMADNGTIEKYCYNNELDSCTKYGGLYQWNEMMQYTSKQGVQGICPPGWHLPTDEEWKVLAGVVDSHYRIGDQEWDNSGECGFDVGTNLKTTSGWRSNGNGTDQYDFSALPGGYRKANVGFSNLGQYGLYWSATESTSTFPWRYFLNYSAAFVYRNYSNKRNGYSVRCVRD